jgi:hypothetical protein
VGVDRPAPASADIDRLLELLIPQIRIIIVQEVAAYRAANPIGITASQASTLQGSVMSILRSQVSSATSRYLSQSAGPASVQDDAAANAILSGMSQLIFQTLEQEVSNAGIFSRGTVFTGYKSFTDLLAQIKAQLRIIILQQIRVWRQAQTVVVPKPVKTNKITSLFGDGGVNNVRVETPNYNYNYGFDSTK